MFDFNSVVPWVERAMGHGNSSGHSSRKRKVNKGRKPEVRKEIMNGRKGTSVIKGRKENR